MKKAEKAAERREDLEAAGVRYLNSLEAIVNAGDAKKAAYAEIKEIMRRENIDEYAMKDVNKVLIRKHRDDEIKVKDAETGSPDSAQQT